MIEFWPFLFVPATLGAMGLKVWDMTRLPARAPDMVTVSVPLTVTVRDVSEEQIPTPLAVAIANYEKSVRYWTDLPANQTVPLSLHVGTLRGFLDLLRKLKSN